MFYGIYVMTEDKKASELSDVEADSVRGGAGKMSTGTRKGVASELDKKTKEDELLDKNFVGGMDIPLVKDKKS